jgi:O-antigen/teichoic acid export membrane protein
LKSKIFINAISSLAQVVIVTIVYFVLYKYLIDKIGIEQLGIWSLILASTSILNISNLGFSSSVIKYVAKYKALGDYEKVIKIIQTSLITVAIVAGIILIIILPFASFILRLIVPTNYLNLSLAILPYSLLSLWLNIQSGIFASALDGFQRIEIKNVILTSGSILYLALTFMLVPKYGLFGVVYAQIFQVLLSLIFNLILVKRIFPEYPLIKYHWNKATFKEIFNYSIKFQGITITQLLYDPITKSLLTKFGGLATTGYYEMASRLVQRVRSLIISANQVLVPTYATIHEESIENVKRLYTRNMNYVHYLTLPLFLFVIAITPLISLFWIGQYETYFVNFLVVLTIAWGINIYSAPAYFANLGIGELNWNLISHIIIGILNLILGIILGYLGGAMFVVYAWGLALIIGSLIIPISFHHKIDLSFSILKNKENIRLIVSDIFAVISSWFLFFYLEYRINIFQLIILTLCSYLFITGYFIWHHSIRINLTKQIKNLIQQAQE